MSESATDTGCACGCALQLSPLDRAYASRLLAILGQHGTYHESTTPAPRREHVEPPEPTQAGICRGCGIRLDLAMFLVDFLALKTAAWPMCQRCNGAPK